MSHNSLCQSKYIIDKEKQNVLHSKKEKKGTEKRSLQCCTVRMDPVFVPSQQVLGRTSIDIQTNGELACHTFSYPSKDARGFPYFSSCVLQDLLQSQYRFHKPLTSCSPTKINLGSSGQANIPARQWAHPYLSNEHRM